MSKTYIFIILSTILHNRFEKSLINVYLTLLIFIFIEKIIFFLILILNIFPVTIFLFAC